MASCSEVAESFGNGNRRVADPQRSGRKSLREPEIVVTGAAWRISRQARGLVPKRLIFISYWLITLSLDEGESCVAQLVGKLWAD